MERRPCQIWRIGEIPRGLYPRIRWTPFRVTLEVMKSKLRRELLVGDLVANAYEAFGKRRANGFLKLAFKSQLVVLRGPNNCLLRGRNRNLKGRITHSEPSQRG